MVIDESEKAECISPIVGNLLRGNTNFLYCALDGYIESKRMISHDSLGLFSVFVYLHSFREGSW